mgnify:CR=1 FL=1
MESCCLGTATYFLFLLKNQHNFNYGNIRHCLRTYSAEIVGQTYSKTLTILRERNPTYWLQFYQLSLCDVRDQMSELRKFIQIFSKSTKALDQKINNILITG